MAQKLHLVDTWGWMCKDTLSLLRIPLQVSNREFNLGFRFGGQYQASSYIYECDEIVRIVYRQRGISRFDISVAHCPSLGGFVSLCLGLHIEMLLNALYSKMNV